MLHHAQRHPVKISFLKRALANHRLRHLAGEGNERHAIHPRIRKAGHQICCAWPAGGHTHARLARGAPVTARGKRAALFVPWQVRANLAGLCQRLMQLHTGSAGIGENTVHPFALQRGHKNFATLHRLAEFAGGFGFRFGSGFFRFAH